MEVPGSKELEGAREVGSWDDEGGGKSYIPPDPRRKRTGEGEEIELG